MEDMSSLVDVVDSSFLALNCLRIGESSIYSYKLSDT